MIFFTEVERKDLCSYLYWFWSYKNLESTFCQWRSSLTSEVKVHVTKFVLIENGNLYAKFNGEMISNF